MKTENKILSIFTIIITALVLITWFSLQSINQLNDNSKLVARTHEVSTVLSDNLSLIQDIETGERGYVITGNEDYLVSYKNGIEKFKANIDKLRDLVSDQAQREQVNNLENASKQKIYLTKEIIDIRAHYGFVSAMKMISTEKGLRLMDKIRSITAAMHQEQEAMLSQRIYVTDKSSQDSKLFIISGGVFAIIAVVFLMLLIGRALKLEKELKKEKEHAEQLVGFKDQFLASMSHEIRTPLNGIIGFTKVLLRNGTTEKQKEQLDAIKTSSDILLVLINDILDLAKIEAGKMTIELTELKLSDLVNSIIGSFELRLQEKDLKITIQYDERIPKIMVGDPVRINQIFLNLLSNAVKFTGNGGQISVCVNLAEQDNEQALIEFAVSDTGIGISDERLQAIFEPFTQSSSDIARRYGGTGLGLSIVKRLTDLMEGSISVQSELQKGTTFTFKLPLQKTDSTEIFKAADIENHPEELKRLGRLKVLLVEDIPINQFLAQTILHDFGFETDTADNGKIAVQLLQQKDYDIILMDLMMPEMNGFEAAKFIRTQMQLPKSNTPIIALTADVTKADVDKCSEVGMNEYVSKPINETDLLNKISRLVKIDAKSCAVKICNLDYLRSHSPNNPKFVKEMVGMFLTQTPAYLLEMKNAITDLNWGCLQGNTHKIRPSIDFLGLPKEISAAARVMEEYAESKQHLELIPGLYLEIDSAFQIAYKELEEELKGLETASV